MTTLRYPLVSLDWWAGNTVDAAGVSWYVNTWSGWDEAPDVRASVDYLPGGDGGTDPDPLFSARFPQFHGVAMAPTVAAAQTAMRQITALLAATRAGSLTVDDGALALTADVRLYGSTPVFARWITDTQFEWGLSLVAPDPRKYAAVVETSTGLPIPSGGVVFPAVFPLSFGTSAGGSIALVNTGTVKTWPVIRFTGPLTNPRLTNKVTGDELRAAITILDSQTLDIDTAARTALLQGTASRRSAITVTGEWLPVAPGAASLQFGADQYDAGALVTVAVRSAYL